MKITSAFAAGILAFGILSAHAGEPSTKTKNVVIVHGGLVDGSGWWRVYRELQKDGYNVAIVQIPTTSLAEDVAATRLILAQQAGPVILVGHSYGGVVISEAGNDPKVRALVYVAAFVPDKGESAKSLIGNPPPGTPALPILPPTYGFLLFDRTKFAEYFAADVSPQEAAFMADSQVPWGVNSLAGAVTNPAWKGKPSWYLVTTADKMVPTPAQLQMAKRANSNVVEVKSSHAVYISHSQAVTKVIEQAAKATE